MIVVYRVTTVLVYLMVYPWARYRVLQGSLLWKNRLGYCFPEKKTVWLHAASVGEVRVMSYLARFLQKKSPGLALHLSAMTQSGYDIAKELLSDDVTVSFLPLDTPASVKRALNTVCPALIVIAETEIWPNLIIEASKRSIGIVQVNGRMSPRAYKRYRLVGRSISKLLGRYTHLFVRTSEDKLKFMSFDITQSRITLAGDMKFDAPPVIRSNGRVMELRHRFGFSREDFVWVAGSTRSGEDEQLVDAYLELSDRNPNLRLALAPRHLDRTSTICDMLREREIPFRTYGGDGLQPAHGKEGATGPVFVLNRFGMLADLYLAADVAFVGGSLVDIGGHNVLEPVWAGVPALTGPYTRNIGESISYIEKGNYGRACEDINDISRTVERIWTGVEVFARREESDYLHSSTALAGEYILERISHG